MAVKYLLPCGCGESLQVDASQAGSKISCACGNELEVPTMRGLRDLAPVEVDDVRESNQDWSMTQGASFSGGLLLVFIGIGLAAYAYQYVREAQPLASFDEQRHYSETIDDLTPVELLDHWNFWQAEGLAHRGTDPSVTARKYRRKYQTVMYVGAGIAVVGLIAMFASMFGKQSSRKPSK